MATPNETLWEIEPHTLAKHEILRRYLGAWFPILATYNSRIVYIDGFCGPGRYKGGELGSPLIALEEAMKHSARLGGTEVNFLFIDDRDDRIAHLQNELSQREIPRQFNVVAKSSEFDQQVSEILDDLDSRGLQLAPTFAFIDPFGFKGLPFALIRRLLANPQTEIFVNLMVDPMNRFLEHPSPKIPQHIIDCFGSAEVLEIAEKSGNRTGDLRLLYQKQLLKHARFVRFFEMRNCDGKTIYYLFFAGNHPLGHLRMKEAFWKVDPSHGFCFSDATNPDQMVFFEDDPTPMVATIISTKFTCRQVPVKSIKKFVEEETPFITRHMRGAMALLEKETKITLGEFKQDGKRRKRNTYPDDAIAKFQ